MDGLLAWWHWIERIAGVVLVVYLCLYAIRCMATSHFLSPDEFIHFLRGLVGYICA
jgi:hypothetical protein